MILHTARQWQPQNIKTTPYFTLMDELWEVYCECYGENWLHYNGSALYFELTKLIPYLALVGKLKGVCCEYILRKLFMLYRDYTVWKEKSGVEWKYNDKSNVIYLGWIFLHRFCVCAFFTFANISLHILMVHCNINRWLSAKLWQVHC